MATGPTSSVATGTSPNDVRDGVLAALFAYIAWGVLPAYFKFMEHVPPTEMVAHRIAWSVPFGLLIILLRRQWGEVISAFRNRRTLVFLLGSSAMISINWTLYVWAVQNDQVFQGSLGYYITPLIYVLVGVVFYNDPFRKLQRLAVLSAAIAVSLLIFVGGKVPVIALVLALSFTTYGIIRKRVDVGGMPGLFVETAILGLPALIYLIWLDGQNNLVFSISDPAGAVNFMLSGPFTVLPLLMFALAARRLTLSTIGFMQFIGPTLQFMLGVYYGEKLTPAYVGCFVLIWIAAALYGYDVWANARQQRANPRST